MTARVAILLLLLINMLTPAPATAGAQSPGVEEETGLTGYVLAPEGTPVSEGTVVARSEFNRTTASIDRTGHFRLVTMRSGLHQILVSVPRLAPYRVSVTVPASRSLRLPVIRLEPASYFRVRFTSAAGEPIPIPPLRRRVFDLSGNEIVDGLGERIPDPAGGDATVIGPLPRGIMTMAVDHLLFAQTRLPDLNIDGTAEVVDGGTVVLQKPGTVLNVNLLDGAGSPVPEHDVFLEDTLPRTPVAFRPVRTNRQGRATFDRLGPGRYRVFTTTVELCENKLRLSTERVLALSGSGTVETRLVVGGRATFHVTLPLGPARGMSLTAAPNVSPPQLPSVFAATRSSSSSGCTGTTDVDGRVTLTNFPPGPAHVAVHTGNSTYVRQVDVPTDGQEMRIVIPDGYLPVRVMNALTNQPVSRASITWTGSGGRVEATATAAGEALLEGVGTGAGTLVASAGGFEPAEEQLAEPPGSPHDIALMPVAPRRPLRTRVITTSGEPLPNAVVELIAENLTRVPRVAVTDAKGVVAFVDLPSGSLQLIASADGFVTSTTRVGEDRTAEIVFKLSHGHRVSASVELPALEGPQAVRVVNDAGASMDALLDSASDRGVEPPGRLSLGPLAPGAYVIELYGARGRRQERIRIVDRDVSTTFR